MTTQDDDFPEPLGNCEHCGAKIMSGDWALYGNDGIWLCKKHSPTLHDTIKYYQDILMDGTWSNDFDDIVEVENILDRLEMEFTTTGNRSMAMVTP